MSDPNHYISVIIPVYNDSKSLDICLNALKKQTLEKSNFEIIVVDNASTDNIEKIKNKYPEASFLYEDEPGSYSARNKGIINAKGNILAFTDADCIPSKDWLERGLKTISHKIKDNIGIVAGEVMYFVDDKENMTAVEVWEMIHKYHQEYFVKDFNFGLTANLFVMKGVIDEVGLFNRELKSAGDLEWGQRAHKKGFKFHFDKELLVKHPAKETIGQFINKVRRLMGGKYMLGMITRTQSIKKIFVDILPPVVNIYRIVHSREFNALGRTDYKVKYILVFLLQRYVTVYELIRLVFGREPVR